MSELLREKQGKGEVTEQEYRNDQGDHGNDIDVHGGLPQLLACLDVKKRHGEEDYGEQQHDQILHVVSHFAARLTAGVASSTRFIFD
jgi:hypothetical protein